MLEIRSTGTVASDVIRDVLAVLDVEESMLDVAPGDEDERDEARNARLVRGDTCDHLDEHPAQPPTSAERRPGLRAVRRGRRRTGSRCAAA